MEYLNQLELVDQEPDSNTDLNNSAPTKLQIGNTPLVSLIKVPKHSGMKCQIYAKLEFRNANKSIYDRLALALINKAELGGIIGPESTLIFGPIPEFCFSLLNVCNSKQYKLLALVPESLTTPRLMNDLKNFGAKICPLSDKSISEDINESNKTKAISAFKSAAFEMAKSLEGTEGGVNLMDFLVQNIDIFDSEIDKFVQEIVSSGIVPDVFVCEVDPFGVLNRVSQKLPETFANCKVFGVTSEAYTVAHNASDFNRPCQIPGANVVSILERGAFRLARDLNKKEDLYCGERGGAVVAGVLKVMDDFFPDKKQDKDFVIIGTLPDSLYHSHGKFLNVDFMREKGYMPEAEFSSLYWWYLMGVGNLTFNTFPSIVADVTVKQAASVLKSHPRILVWSKSDHKRDVDNVMGVLTEDAMKLIEVKRNQSNCDKTSLAECSEFLHAFGALDCRGKLGELDKLLETYPFAILYNDIFEFTAGAEAPTYFKTPLALVSVAEMNEWVYSVEEHHRLQYGWEPGVGFMKENYPESADEDPNTNTV